uniref:Uncharacterized protein n=1 Tax=Setaria digitata TaxID=48799 RepID=A0A915Q7L7_9BILA
MGSTPNCNCVFGPGFPLKIWETNFLEINCRSCLTPAAVRSIVSSYKETGTSNTYSIGSNNSSSSDSSSESVCTVPAKQHYHNNVTTSNTIPYDNHSKEPPKLFQDVQKKTDIEVTVAAVKFKQKKHLTKGSHSFVMTQATDCSQSACLSQNLLPPIHETLTSFRQPSPLLHETTVHGSHRHHLQNHMTSTDLERPTDNFERNQQHQYHTTQPPVTSKSTIVMQDVCSDGGGDAINNDTMYTQQQITAMVTDTDYLTKLMPASTLADNSNDHSDEQHYYTATTNVPRHQQHYMHNDYTPSGLFAAITVNSDYPDRCVQYETYTP